MVFGFFSRAAAQRAGPTRRVRPPLAGRAARAAIGCRWACFQPERDERGKRGGPVPSHTGTAPCPPAPHPSDAGPTAERACQRVGSPQILVPRLCLLRGMRDSELSGVVCSQMVRNYIKCQWPKHQVKDPIALHKKRKQARCKKATLNRKTWAVKSKREGDIVHADANRRGGDCISKRRVNFGTRTARGIQAGHFTIFRRADPARRRHS